MKRYAIWISVGLVFALTIWASVGFSNAAAACSNEAIRTGPSALLPECRAYEMVSPADKSGSGVSQVVEVRTAPSGNGVSFFSSASFAGAPSSSMIVSYVGRRSETDWTTENINAPQVNSGGLVVLTSPASSAELETTLQYSKVALAPGAIEEGSNIYLHDNATGERELVVAQAGNKLFQNISSFSTGGFLDGTADFGHVIFDTTIGLLPEAAAGKQNVYEFADGELRLVNRMDDGTVNPIGGRAESPNGTPYAHAISADGSRIFFMLSNFGAKPLYMREDGATTVPISASQKEGEEGVVADAEFSGATPDGSVAYFTSLANLTDESATFNSPTLYRYDVDSGVLTDLLAGLSPTKGAQVKRVMAVSEDGAYVYFAAHGALTDDSVESGFLGSNIYVWHEGTVELVAALSNDSRESQGPSQRMASPSGDRFAFATVAPLSADDPPSPACPSTSTDDQMCRDVYAYDATGNELSCVTCTDSPALGDSDLGGQVFHERGIGDHFPHAVLDDGTVFADSPDPLLARDINGIGDVYAWRDGEPTLLSSGMSAAASTFGDSTADGGTVFIRTAEPLVGRDVDAAADLYAVRVGGGLAAQSPPGQPSPCEGEGCRATVPPAPPVPQPTTNVRRADGNVPEACAQLERRATLAERRADRLERRLRRLRPASGKALKRLRRKLRTERKKANRLATKARSCGGQDR